MIGSGRVGSGQVRSDGKTLMGVGMYLSIVLYLYIDSHWGHVLSWLVFWARAKGGGTCAEPGKYGSVYT